MLILKKFRESKFVISTLKLATLNIVIASAIVSPSLAFNLTGLTAPRGIVIDSSNNLYVTDATAQRITRAPLSGGSSTLTGLTNPFGIAIDSNGSIFYSTNTGGSVDRVNSTFTSAATFISGLSSPSGLAIDSSDNLYVTQTIPSGGVSRITPLGVVTPFISGISGRDNPRGIAFDNTTGNLYVGFGLSNSTVVKYSSSGAELASITIPSGVFGLAFSAGNLFVSGFTADSIFRVDSNLTSAVSIINNTTLSTDGLSGLNNPAYIAILGNRLYVSENGNGTTPPTGRVLEYQLQPIPFEFSPILGTTMLAGIWFSMKLIKTKNSKSAKRKV